MACAQTMAHPVAQPDETGTRITERTRKGMGMKHHHNIDELREALADKRGRIALSRRGFLQGAGVMAAGAAAAGMIAGCSPQTEGSSNASDPRGGEAMATTGSTAAATGNEGKTMGEVLGAG